MNSNITVSGNIISELSEKIPSNIVALNELIKNAYDAGADNVYVTLDSNKNKLMIYDDGEGMDKDDIDTLFHISNSKKRYGEINKHKRYTQGSKGLGFLSVFKFGERVTWRTKKNRGLVFSVEYSKLLENDNISNYEIEILEDNTIEKGTMIEIDISPYNSNSLQEYFGQEKNYQKVVHSFLDNEFVIHLDIDGKKDSNIEEFKIIKCLPERQLYYIKYNSDDKEIQYYFNGRVIHRKYYDIEVKDYKLEIELQVFKFNKGDKSKINKLFYNPQNDLTPLMYINCNLFNNYSLFDPNVMKNIKSGQALNQMIGYIKLTTSDSRMGFNSDRTQFLQNEFTDQICEFLRELNKTIQKEGAEFRKHLVECDFLKQETVEERLINVEDSEKYLRSLIKSTFHFRDKVNIEVDSDVVRYSIFGKEVVVKIIKNDKKEEGVKDTSEKPGQQGISNVNTSAANNNIANTTSIKSSDNKEQVNNKSKVQPAKIVLKNRNQKHKIPSGQIDLYTNIKEAVNSKGEYIPLSQIQIKVDNRALQNGILQTIKNVCIVKVEYSYLDSNTGVVIAENVIEFYQPMASINGNSDIGKLISIPANKSYRVNFNTSLSRLIEQINGLELSDYSEVIACALRSIFEISVDSLIKSGKFTGIYTSIKGLEERVEKTIQVIIKDKKNIGAIATATSIDFNSLKNSLKPLEFKDAIQKANLGAHKSTTYLSENDIKHLSRMAALFIIVVNEMINNSSIA
jgi:hypothetical protein